MSDFGASYNLHRFLDAQALMYGTALREIRTGRKDLHWIWYIFPQLRGLGCSSNSHYYGIADIGEAEAYLHHSVLGSRLREISEALLAQEGKSAWEILGGIDARKVRSSMTLFDAVSPGDVFSDVLKKYYDGQPDPRTLEMLKED